ncbi:MULTISPECIES: THUMP domain-containing class I SAM-dependent RNA methyltransferase [Lactobacillus]|uniref:Class I SAM-dependent RNA methyltransferase n=1 Tax=Lactobacillus panisapium TaxID=2012495 RepID=A0ABX8W9F7_9LACO|nr:MULTISPECIES: class I SAM-dependent RNA methyltransferase [Lactobacillus]MCO6535400.1 class I SAM-dependent RNA methyltransferase [Lactobacillus sp.]MCX8721086.1 class I SAM-dependent RNA methyltransferase [Lactobacillus sp. B4010]MCX8725431.1 class I SAM-dependent RNA methyltransferase [Lactobacillus sp. B4007]MCX8732085.1 class I SAM-dependent RNA methyltransferase [Lactobacillus sp. B4015]MCX8734228.1 class I SAM-dependent RNA methyltransferase [Lactobacillus sp. B4012]
MKQYQLYTTMGAGFESVVAKELQSLGYQTQTENGRVFFKGDQADIVKTNLWLRTADRVKILLKEFRALDFDTLYNQVYDIDWAELLPVDAKFPVQGRAVRSKLHSEPGIQSIVKKAIVNKMSDQYHRRGFLPESGNEYPLDIHIYKDVARISLDTTGASLFKRGYRIEHGGAPLKENFGASLIKLTPYDGSHPLIDPMTGSGTLAIEAALIGRNIAPGSWRKFAFDGFDWFDQSLHEEAVEEARTQVKPLEQPIWACDIDQSILEIAKLNANNAGVLQDIYFKQVAVKDFATDLKNGVIIANPPYGKRLKEKKSAEELYQQMGEALLKYDDFSQYYLVGDPLFEEFFGKKATKKRKLFNGNLRVDFYQYWAKKK